MTDRIDVEAYRDDVGTVHEYRMEPITRLQSRRYARAIGDDNPLFHDVEYARRQGYDDLVVPPDFPTAIIEHDEGVPGSRIREDGVNPDRFPFEMPDGAQVLGGGKDLTFHRYLTAGEALTIRVTFADLYQKQGRTMGTLTFFVRLSEYFDEAGEPVVDCEETVIVGDAP